MNAHQVHRAPFDNFIPVIQSEHPLRHTLKRPFCFDPTCPCHADPENINAINALVRDGLLTRGEAARMIQGETL